VNTHKRVRFFFTVLFNFSVCSDESRVVEEAQERVAWVPNEVPLVEEMQRKG
jgi:hypothetical protein